jgi:hypothetical protein
MTRERAAQVVGLALAGGGADMGRDECPHDSGPHARLLDARGDAATTARY